LTLFDRFVIGAIAGMNAVTIYSVPFNILMRVSILPTSWQNALFPRYVMVSEEESRRLLSSSVRCQAWMMTPIILTGILLIKPFISLWIGPLFAAKAAPVGQILFLGLWFTALACVPYYLLQSRGRPDIPAKFHVIELFFYAPMLWFLIGQLGVNGAAWAWDFRVALDMALLYRTTQALDHLFEARWGLIWIVAGLGWAVFDAANIALYYAGAAIMLFGCGLWTWYSVPVEMSRLLPKWPAFFSH
jgi:O-antigen/teichoic acid export membrane protein